MSILTATGVSQSFGPHDVFSGVSLSIPNDGKIGLVGPNGVGKTTLLLILAGETRPSDGQVMTARGSRIGYLPQEAAQAFTANHHTVYEELLALFAALREQEKAIAALARQIADRPDDAELLEEYSRAQIAFEAAGGYEYELRIKQVLTGLGFPEDKWDLPLAHLSGGQKTRVLLARLLLDQPDLLILDEPTNHLDVAAIEWLEGTLRLWNGAVLIVSHDRYFLDRVVNTIWELSQTGMESYRGNYSAYVEQREARWGRREKEFTALKERLDKEMDYIRRNIAGQRTQMAKGKLSRLSREVEALHAGGLDALTGRSWSQAVNDLALKRAHMDVAIVAQRINELPRPNYRPVTLNIQFQPAMRSGNIVLRSRDLAIGYPGTHLFAADDIELKRLECAALIGPNGAGKSTFLKTLLAQLAPLAGELVPGASLKIGYFAQAHDRLHLNNNVLDEFLTYHPMAISEARSYLARFLFRGDEVYQLIETLSGGQRGRLALAILALEDANFLLLDEPTNHLDIPAQEVLQTALEQFDGTILLVSHDRYLVNRLATQIWDLRDGHLRIYKGSYQDYLAQREADAQALKEAAQAERQEQVQSNDNGAPKLSKNEQRRREEALEKLMLTIENKELAAGAVAEALQVASEAQDFDKIQTLSIEYETLQEELNELIAQWEAQASE
ncbi:MAG: ABC-F family ATP-binding cassette domain-containing protein [Anaerolineales bacterium]|nr:ABC-F family ATP-binding cassette domain-containing protein [Anaerolineales bacterium]MCB8959167.1 ABC-F family ATP-binding cassette domain-containing protein [Ardenticatenales bacterium]